MGRNQSDRQRRTDEVLYFLEDRPAGNILYVGRTADFASLTSDAIWQIKRVVRTGSVTETRYAESGKYNCVWDIRTTYFPPAVSDDSADTKPVAIFDQNGDPFTISNPLNVTASFSGLRIGGRITLVQLNDTTWTPLPAVALANRNALSVQNVTLDEIKLQYNPATVGYVGVRVGSGFERFYDISDAITMYGKSAPGTSPLVIAEELS